MTKAIPTSNSVNNIEKYRFVFCSGMPRSGSTCVYNIARLLLNECYKDTTIYSDYVGEGKPVDETIKAYFNKGVIFLIKFHRALQSELAFPMVETGLAKNIYTSRNPMNAAYSVHDFFKIPFKKAVNSIELSLEDQSEWVKRPNSLFIDFPEINADLLSVIRKVAKHLGLSPSEHTLKKIAEEVSYENMKKKAESLNENSEQLHKQFHHDKETLLHIEHAPQNQKRNWRESLSQEQIEYAQERFKPWLEESYQGYGYLQEDINQFADADNIVCWTFCNEGHIDMAYNWWSHFSKSNPDRKPTIITISQNAKDYFTKQGIPCIMFNPPFQVSDQEVDFRKNSNWTKIVACKLDICREILSKNHYSFFNDSDVVVMKQIKDEVQAFINSGEVDIKFQKNHLGSICSGVYLATPSDANIKLFDRHAQGLEIYDTSLNHYGEQDFLKKRLEQMQGNIEWNFLPQKKMPNGAIWYNKKDFIRNDVILVHYNCVVSKDKKIKEMEKDGVWNSNGKAILKKTACASDPKQLSTQSLKSKDPWKNTVLGMLKCNPPANAKKHNLPAQLILSLTSFPKRFRTLPLTLQSLISQTIQPDKIILWIAHEDKHELTQEVLNFKNKGLEIKYCKNLKSYNKIIHTLQEYPGSFITTADDDIYYWPTWLEELVSEYDEEQKEIVAHRVHRIKLDNQGCPKPYHEWEWQYSRETQPSSLNFSTGVGGVLYPPGAFHQDVCKKEIFQKICPDADDVWLYWMYRLQGYQAKITSTTKTIVVWPETQHNPLWQSNVKGRGNDKQIQAMIEIYGMPFSESIESTKKENRMLTQFSMTGLQKEHFLIKDNQFKNKEQYNLHLIHKAAHNYVLKYIEGKDVLDLGCNTGYGTAILRQNAKSIIGIDVSENAINFARKNYGSYGIEFYVTDGIMLNFEDNSFDCATSFQVLEHIVDYDSFFSEIKRVLRPNGTIYLTTPNAKIRLVNNQKPWNKYHNYEFTPIELQNFLSRYFDNVKVLGLFSNYEIYNIELKRLLNINPKISLPSYAVNRLKEQNKQITLDYLKNYFNEQDLYYSDVNIDSALDLLVICKLEMFSEKYWKTRYQKGGNSGIGSYGQFAKFKADVINNFVKDNNINSVIEFGCGDGNQLRFFEFKKYLGFDVSPLAISKCKEIFKNDKSKKFIELKEYQGQKADLVLSLDVIYHLIEDRIFEEHINYIFNASKKYVIIYSSNFDQDKNIHGAHVKHRKFTDYVEKNFPEWNLLMHVPNKYPYQGDSKKGSFADFYIYQKQSKKTRL